MPCESTGLPNASLAVPFHDSESNKTTTSRLELEKWAELIAASAMQSANPTRILPVVADMPEAWRTDVEALTPEAGSSQGTLLARESIGLSTSSYSAAGDEAELNRIQLRLNAGDLGELSLVVERSVSGLHIQIGAENIGVLAAIARNSSSMTYALSSIGQPVTSLAFVAMDGLGTVLAPSKGALGNQPNSSKSDGNLTQEKTQARRRGRRIDVLG
jgi:hypothetical protein